ncbi:MAG: agmatine deiminase family protein [Dysgonamonadaceae bacterium]|jgi:agmatine/peptidylarginine deiminase|nr:agmatine deiminase family protein [Dysgonamonadaceae bacterium]
MAHVVFPAEWYPQSGVQIAWPHAGSDWFNLLDEVIACYIAISKEILRREKLMIVCPETDEVEACFTEEERRNLILAAIKTNDTWARDHGGLPLFVNGTPTIFDFGFNAWGLKFAANYDNLITQELFRQDIFKPEVQYRNLLNFILEGGSIETDGKGTLLTTSQCLLAPNRNQPMSPLEIEDFLIKTLGLKRVLWLNHGYLAGDDTDNHIDTLARFCDEQTIAYVQCLDENDEHFDELQAMEKELQAFLTEEGKPYNLIALPMADETVFEGYRLPATYANFLIINGAVLLPFYDSAKDETARRQLQKAFPDREIVGIDCRSLIKQHGSLHCATMQLPKGFL